MLFSAFSDSRARSALHRADLTVERSSIQKGWRGLHLEIGHNHGCDVRSLILHGHVVGMQITGQQVPVEIHENGRWVTTSLPSHQLFVHRAGTPLDIRHDIWTRWAIAIVDHPLLNDRIPQSSRLSGWSCDDGILTLLFQALVDQLCQEQRDSVGDQVLTRSLIESFVLALHRRQRGSPLAFSKGGISPQMVADLRGWIEENLDQKISVGDMADHLGYSCAHFAREFKREMGVTPYGFLQEIRLSTAMSLGSKGVPLIDIAHQCGFADQAHFSNAFKSRFGLSPTKLRKRN